jgi:hypothetical protein
VAPAAAGVSMGIAGTMSRAGTVAIGTAMPTTMATASSTAIMPNIGITMPSMAIDTPAAGTITRSGNMMSVMDIMDVVPTPRVATVNGPRAGTMAAFRTAATEAHGAAMADA